MSPKIDDFKKDLGRDLKPGDILIGDEGLLYEITEVGNEYPSIIGAIRGRISGYVNARRLTSSGPSVNESHFRTNVNSYWNGVIREEDRTDKPSLRER